VLLPLLVAILPSLLLLACPLLRPTMSGLPRLAFSIGDRVRVKETAKKRFTRGRVGIVEQLNAVGRKPGIVFDAAVNFGWFNWGFRADELELAVAEEEDLEDTLSPAAEKQIPDTDPGCAERVSAARATLDVAERMIRFLEEQRETKPTSSDSITILDNLAREVHGTLTEIPLDRVDCSCDTVFDQQRSEERGKYYDSYPQPCNFRIDELFGRVKKLIVSIARHIPRTIQEQKHAPVENGTV
jgi:hypothetical protein